MSGRTQLQNSSTPVEVDPFHEIELGLRRIPGTERFLPELTYDADMPTPDASRVAAALAPLTRQVIDAIFEPLGKFVAELCDRYPEYEIREGWIGISEVSLNHGIRVSVILCREDARYNELVNGFVHWMEMQAGHLFGEAANISVSAGRYPFESTGDSPKLPREEHPERWRRVFADYR